MRSSDPWISLVNAAVDGGAGSGVGGSGKHKGVLVLPPLSLAVEGDRCLSDPKHLLSYNVLRFNPAKDIVQLWCGIYS